MKAFDKNGKLLLDIDENKELSRGGEGRVIEIPRDRVAKIYLPGVKCLKEEKFNELSKLKSNTFVKPEELLFNQSGIPIGFTMRKVPSDHFPLISIFNKTFCNRQNIVFETKRLIVEKIVNALNFAHSEGVLVGDLNPYNIMVNDAGSVYFIDVDSYETPSFKHSGILLEDIRDFLYNGEVNKKSDYFALALISFNALTFVHPFKGVHKKYPSITDRMIRKESVLKGSSDLIVPKCYEPLSNSILNEQFERIFNNGERFVIQITNTVAITKVKVSTSIKTDQLIMHVLHTGKIVTSASSKELLAFIDSGGYIRTIDLSVKGTFTKVRNYYWGKNRKTKLFIYKKSLFAISNNILYFDEKQIMDFKEKVKSYLYGNILVVITSDMMYKFKLDSTYGDVVPYDIISVYGGRFSNIDGLFQNVSESTILFYESRNALNSAVLSSSVKNIVQSDNVGVIEKIENEKIVYKYFTIKNLQVELFDCSLDGLRYLDLLNPGAVIVPGDDKLVLLRTEDMKPIVEFKCAEVSENSVIHCTNAGIVIVNDDSIYLTNKK